MIKKMKIHFDKTLRHVIYFVALANISFFFVEFAMARSIGSVSLFADSIDFLEDASVNFLILLCISWSAKNRARVGMVLACLILVPGLSTLWMTWQKLIFFVPPEPLALSLTGIGALAVNLTCALMLAQHRHHGSSLVKAAFLSARNDVLANIAIILTGPITTYTNSALPDLIVGLAIASLNVSAAKEVWDTAKKEHLELGKLKA
ncbi:MAG: cation transporter [Proteobacteria bacterium]|nr:cation transporter [Pseudomonadota bacterium]